MLSLIACTLSAPAAFGATPAATGADAVMSAEALLEDPTLFNGGCTGLGATPYCRRQCGFSRLYLERCVGLCAHARSLNRQND